MMRLQLAAEVTISIGIVIAVEWAFVRATGALQAPIPSGAPPALAAELWAANHALMVVAMMLGAMIAMISGFGVSMYATARSQLVTLLILPLPMLATLALGLSLHVRVASLASLAVVLAIGTYCRRFGPRGFNGGVLAFMGAFLGFFIQDLVPIAEYGWLAAEVGVGAAVTTAVHFTLFCPRPGAAVRRMQRSYAARAFEVASEVADLYSGLIRSGGLDTDHRAEKKLQRKLLRLNEAVLLIDARLDNPAAVPAGWSAATLHQRLFDAEVALSNVARFAPAIARRKLPGAATALAGQALADIRDADLDGALASARAIRDLVKPQTLDPERSLLTPADRVLLHRFATSVTEFSTALRAFRRYPSSQAPDDEAGDFRTEVMVFGGWLPGSSFVSRDASLERGGAGLIDRIRLAPYARIAVQMGIAVGGATVAGDAVSGRRFYWAVLAAFISFMGTNTAGEQLRKAAFRVAGTLIGVILGSLLAHLAGDRVGVQIAIVLAAVFGGLYLFRVNYTFMVIGITVMVAQLYVELDEFSNGLMALRLGETALGAGVAMATTLLVLPLHIGRVARVAARQQVEALADLADRCLDRLADPGSAAGSDLELRAAARRADNAYQALVATIWPMRTPLFGRLASQITGFMATVVGARHYAHNLVLDASTCDADLDPAVAAELGRARRQLADSVSAITVALAPPGNADPGHPTSAGNASPGQPTSAGNASPGQPTVTAGQPVPAQAPGQYVRSASLFAHIAGALPDAELTSRPQLALRDLQLLDGALAEAARWASVPVTDLDTAPSQCPHQ